MRVREARLLTGFAAAVALSGSLLFGVYVWPTAYRPIRIDGRDELRVLAAREHRRTGQVEFLTRSGWHAAWPPITRD